MSSVRKRVFTGTSTAPICMIANIAWSHSGRLTIQSATRSPGAMPSWSSPFAAASTPAWSSAKVQRFPWKASASRAPQRRAARSGRSPIVCFSCQSPMTPSRTGHAEWGEFTPGPPGAHAQVLAGLAGPLAG